MFEIQEDLSWFAENGKKYVLDQRLRGRANALPLSFRFAALQIRSEFYPTR